MFYSVLITILLFRAAVQKCSFLFLYVDVNCQYSIKWKLYRLYCLSFSYSSATGGLVCYRSRGALSTWWPTPPRHQPMT